MIFVFLFCLFGGGFSYATSTPLEALFQKIDQKQVSHLEEVLPLLPSDLRTSFTLQYNGNGLQQASRSAPRAILFGLDAQFIVTFNGDASHEKYNSLEILQFNNQKSEFELYEIEFPLKRDSSGAAIRPTANPKSCVACHGSDPKPFWEIYSFWPGVYGSEDDFLDSANSELSDFEKFMNQAPQHARYKFLQPMKGSELSPFRTKKQRSFQFRPNLRIGALLSGLNAKRVARKIKSAAHYSKYAPLLAIALECGQKGNWVGDPTSPSQFWSQDDQDKLNAWIENEFKKQGIKIPYPNMNYQSLKNLIALVGTSVEDWSVQTNNSENEPTNSWGMGRIDSGSLMFEVLWPNLVSVIPGLEYGYKRINPTAYGDGLIQTSFDRAFAAAFDKSNLASQINFGKGNYKQSFEELKGCNLMYEYIRKNVLAQQ